MATKTKPTKYQVQFRVVAILELEIEATDLKAAIDVADTYELSDFLAERIETVHDGSVKVVGVDDEWGDVS